MCEVEVDVVTEGINGVWKGDKTFLDLSACTDSHIRPTRLESIPWSILLQMLSLFWHFTLSLLFSHIFLPPPLLPIPSRSQNLSLTFTRKTLSLWLWRGNKTSFWTGSCENLYDQSVLVVKQQKISLLIKRLQAIRPELLSIMICSCFPVPQSFTSHEKDAFWSVSHQLFYGLTWNVVHIFMIPEDDSYCFWLSADFSHHHRCCQIWCCSILWFLTKYLQS